MPVVSRHKNREVLESGKQAVGLARAAGVSVGFGTALDIPLKVLVWEDRNGAVSVSYNSPGFLAGGRQRCRALSGGSPAGAAAAAGPLARTPPRPVHRPRPVGHVCKKRTAVPLAPGILSPSKDHRQGARLRRGAARWRKRHPLSSDLPRRTSAPIEGDGGEPRPAPMIVT
jgi:hypothetical protein